MKEEKVIHSQSKVQTPLDEENNTRYTSFFKNCEILNL